MTDIRERHVPIDTVRTMDSEADLCACGDRWPCDAIREAARADKYAAVLARIADLTEGEPRMSGESTFASHREGRIHNLVREAFGEEPIRLAEHYLTLQDRADKAEAALAACRDMVDKSIDTTNGLLSQRDAARADAERLAEALVDFGHDYDVDGRMEWHSHPTREVAEPRGTARSLAAVHKHPIDTSLEQV
jgi:hypothetical protein